MLKQPLAKFQSEAEWLVDIDRAKVERNALELCGNLLPPGSVPEVLWFDEANYVLALSCAPLDAVLWKKQLLTGYVSADAAQLAGTLLAILHSATRNEAEVAARYRDPKFFIQQRTDPYLAHLKNRYPDLAPTLDRVIRELLSAEACLIHGDFSPKNIVLVPRTPDDAPAPVLPRKGRLHPDNPLAKGRAPKPKKFDLARLLLLDFEVCFYGHPGFDIATLINHLLLKSFHHGARGGGNWRPTMIAIDAFWQTYLHTADQGLAALVERSAGHMLGALLLARIDGKSPVEYITDEAAKERVRSTARRHPRRSRRGVARTRARSRCRCTDGLTPEARAGSRRRRPPRRKRLPGRPRRKKATRRVARLERCDYLSPRSLIHSDPRRVRVRSPHHPAFHR